MLAQPNNLFDVGLLISFVFLILSLCSAGVFRPSACRKRLDSVQSIPNCCSILSSYEASRNRLTSAPTLPTYSSVSKRWGWLWLTCERHLTGTSPKTLVCDPPFSYFVFFQFQKTIQCWAEAKGNPKIHFDYSNNWEKKNHSKGGFKK